MLITKNWSERNQAEKLGMDIPKAIQEKTKILFYKSDVRRAFVDEDGSIMLVMNDDSRLELEYEENKWKELEVYFRENEE